MTRYLSLAEYVWLAEQVTGVESAVLMKASRLHLADSALHAPSAGFEDQDFYPDIVDKAAVLTCRLAWNHPLPDGNKRGSLGFPRAVHRLERRLSGTRTRPTSTRRRSPCSPLPPTRSTRPGSPTGYGVGCTSAENALGNWLHLGSRRFPAGMVDDGAHDVPLPLTARGRKRTVRLAFA